MIRYSYAFDDGTELAYEVDETGEISPEDPGGPASGWVELERFKCERCSVPSGSRRSCPAALAIKSIVDELGSRVSFEQVEMTVEKEGMTIRSTTSIQQASRSLIGLVLPLSACPVMMKLRPMARVHLPMGSRVHTAFRFLGMYLVAQFMRAKMGREPDWDMTGLLELLEDIHMVNRSLTERIRFSKHMDATVNALVGLDFFADNVEWSIEDSLEELGPLFETWLEG